MAHWEGSNLKDLHFEIDFEVPKPQTFVVWPLKPPVVSYMMCVLFCAERCCCLCPSAGVHIYVIARFPYLQMTISRMLATKTLMLERINHPQSSPISYLLDLISIAGNSPPREGKSWIWLRSSTGGPSTNLPRSVRIVG